MLTAPRQLAAFALVGYAALHLVFAFFDWLLWDGGRFSDRSAGAGFTALVELAMPVVAVLLATQIQPTLRLAKVIAAVALVEYAVIVVLGLFALLIGVAAVADGPFHNPNAAFDALAYFVLGFGRLILAAIAGLVSYQAFTRLGGVLPWLGGTTRSTTPPVPWGEGSYSSRSLAALRSRSSRPPHMKKACSGYVS